MEFVICKTNFVYVPKLKLCERPKMRACAWNGSNERC